MSTEILVIEEKEYRDLPINSSSSLKDFANDRRKYHKKHLLKEKVEEKPNKASEMGRLVETLLMEPELFDKYFFMSGLPDIPGGLTGDFIYYLANEVAKEEDEDIEDERFLELAKIAYKKSGFKIKFETVLKKLEDPSNELYYKETLQVLAKQMVVVTPQDIENAEKIVEGLKNGIGTSTIVNTKTSGHIRVYNQMKIKGFNIDGLPMKAMLDKVIIDDKIRKIYFYDLKCTWSVEGFYKEYYLYRKSYIQAYTYYRGLLALTQDVKSELYGYTVELPSFVVCDSINYYEPLVYTLTKEDMKDAYEGFTAKNKNYPGVKEIISDLKWALQHNIWNISKKNYENHGTLNIKE